MNEQLLKVSTLCSKWSFQNPEEKGIGWSWHSSSTPKHELLSLPLAQYCFMLPDHQGHSER